MYKYVKFNEENGLCTEVGKGTNEKFYQSIGMVYTDVEQSEVDGNWYLKPLCPHYTDEEKEEALDQAIAELGKEMSKAILMGNTEWQAELQAQYNALMEE